MTSLYTPPPQPANLHVQTYLLCSPSVQTVGKRAPRIYHVFLSFIYLANNTIKIICTAARLQRVRLPRYNFPRFSSHRFDNFNQEEETRLLRFRCYLDSNELKGRALTGQCALRGGSLTGQCALYLGYSEEEP